MPRVFISYARADSDIAARLADELRADNEVFLDVDSLPVGANFQEELRRTIEKSDVVLVLMSPAYFSSQWAKTELSLALEEGKRLLPVRLSGEPDGALSYLVYLDASDLSTSELAAKATSVIRSVV